MTIIIVLAAVLDVGFIGGIVYLIFGKLLHSNALGKLFGIVAGIACGALMLWILGGDNDISVGTGCGLIFVPAGIFLLMLLILPKNKDGK